MLTIIEAHELADALIDKANAPWFSPEEKDMYFNLSQNEFIDKNHRRFEFDEEVRAKLNPVVRRQIFGSITEVNLSGVDNFRYVLRLKGTFEDKCGNNVKRKISPVQWDDEADAQLDPFNVNDNENPGYVQENVAATGNILTILSDTAPSDVELVYLRTPNKVLNDLVTPANNVGFTVAPSAHEEIVNLAVRKMLGTVENQSQYQVQANEIVDQNQNTK